MSNYFVFYSALIPAQHMDEPQVRALRDLLTRYRALRSENDRYEPFKESGDGIHFQVTRVNDDYTLATDNGGPEVRWLRTALLDELIGSGRINLTRLSSFDSCG